MEGAVERSETEGVRILMNNLSPQKSLTISIKSKSHQKPPPGGGRCKITLVILTEGVQENHIVALNSINTYFIKFDRQYPVLLPYPEHGGVVFGHRCSIIKITEKIRRTGLP